MVSMVVELLYLKMHVLYHIQVISLKQKCAFCEYRHSCDSAVGTSAAQDHSYADIQNTCTLPHVILLKYDTYHTFFILMKEISFAMSADDVANSTEVTVSN